jgi:hypothetical protein
MMPGLLESGPVGRQLGAWVVLSFVTLGCASAGSLNGNVFRGQETSYQIAVPGPPWQRVGVNKDNDLSWHSAAKAGVLQVDSKCNPDFDIPLQALTMHLLIGFTDQKVISQQTLPMDGREAMRTHLQAKLDGVPREMLLQVLKKDGCVYDFALITPPGPAFDEALPDFDALLAGFRTPPDAR